MNTSKVNTGVNSLSAMGTTTATENKPAKTMQQIENQAFRLSEMNWRRKNVWETSEAAKAAKNNRDGVIDKAYLNAAAYHLNNKAKSVHKYLKVWVLDSAFAVCLDYNSPGFGCTVKIGSPFDIETLLNDPSKIWGTLNA